MILNPIRESEKTVKSKEQKVLIIRNAWEFGGAEMYTLNLAIALRKNGYAPVVVTKVPELLERCRHAKISLKKGIWYKKQGWGRAYKVLGPLITAWYLWIIVISKIDIVHAQGRDDFVFATRAAKMLGKKVVWTDHADLKYIMQPHNKKVLRDSIVQLAQYTAGVIAVSDSEKKEILKQYHKFPNLVTIRNGVFLPATIKSVKKPNKIIIGSTNRLVMAKGIAELIEAFSRISDFDKCELWLVGDGEDKEEFVDLAKKLGVASKVKFLGYKKDIWAYLGAFDIFVQASYHEAFSLSLIEAGVSGKAVIATKVGGNTEIINNQNGILVLIKDVDSLKDALNIFVSNPKVRQDKSRILKKFAVANFDFDKLVKEKLIPIYEK